METFAETLITTRYGIPTVEEVATSITVALVFFLVVFWILTVIASWKILQKAGEPGWKAIIPIYNIYMLYKIVGMSGWFWAEIVCSFVLGIIMVADNTSETMYMTTAQLQAFDWGSHIPTLIGVIATCIFSLALQVIYSIRTSKAFGHGGGFAAGLFFLPIIFWFILGFGSSKYNKKVALKK